MIDRAARAASAISTDRGSTSTMSCTVRSMGPPRGDLGRRLEPVRRALLGAAPTSGSAATGEAIRLIVDERAAPLLWLRVGERLFRRAPGRFRAALCLRVAGCSGALAGVPGAEGVCLAAPPIPFGICAADAAVAITAAMRPLLRGLERPGACEGFRFPRCGLDL